MATPASSSAQFCAACANRTTKQCSGCKTHFCSPECQRLTWSTHKWLCRNKNKPFSHAPLTEVEVVWLRAVCARKQGGSVPDPVNWRTQLERDGLLAGDDIDNFLRDLCKADCPIAEPRRSFAIANLRGTLLVARDYGVMEDWSDDVPPFKPTPWIYVGSMARTWKRDGPNIAPDAAWYTRLDAPLRYLAVYAALKFHPDGGRPDVVERKKIVEPRIREAVARAVPQDAAKALVLSFVMADLLGDEANAGPRDDNFRVIQDGDKLLFGYGRPVAKGMQC